MAGKYKSFKYDTDVYGNYGPAITQSYLFAQALDYSTIQITIEAPDKIGQPYVLVRSNHGSAEDPSDGFTVSSGTIATAVTTVSDESVSASSGTAYYTLFGLDDEGAWYKDAATSVVTPADKSTSERIIDFLPSMYSSYDGNPLSPTNYDSDLANFLFAFALTYDELSSMIDFILPENRDRYTTRRLSDIFVTGVGMPNEYLIGVAANARLYRESGYVYRNKGTVQGIATYVEALTGWQTLVKESNNKFLSLDDGSFEYGTGNWSWDEAEMALVTEAIDDITVTGPTIEYETADYPFSRLSVGSVTLVAPAARMSLPANNDRLLAIPVSPGKTYYVAVPARGVSGTPVVQPTVTWLDETGAELSTSILSDIETGPVWSVAGGPVIAPVGAVFAVLHIDIVGAPTDNVHLDMLSFTEEVARFRTNLFLNPSAESDLDNVALTDSADRSLATSSAHYKYGNQSFLLTSADATARTLGLRNDTVIEAAEAETFTGSAYVRSSRPGIFDLTFTWLDETDSVITVSSSDVVAVSAGEWTRLFYTVTAPATTTHLQFAVNALTPYTNTESLWVDGFLVEKSDRLGDWFAGSTGTTYGASGLYGDFVFSTYDVGYIYRDPRTVTIICQPDRLNLVHDPSFELETTTWQVDDGALEISTDQFISGSSSGKASGETWAFRSNDVPVVGDYAYSISAHAFSAAGTASVEIRWYDYTDSLLGTDILDFDTLTEAWTSLTGTVVSPATSVYASIVVSGTDTVYIDNVIFERADRPQIFFCGDTSDLDNQDGRWSGGGPGSYSLLYNKAPIKLGRLMQTLPYYLPLDVNARVLLWDSSDPEVQALIPRGVYENQ